MHDALSDPRYRSILFHLQGRADPVTVAAVTRGVESADRSPSEATPGDGAEDVSPGDVRGRVLEMVALGILGYDVDADAVWIPADVTISVAPPSAPGGSLESTNMDRRSREDG